MACFESGLNEKMKICPRVSFVIACFENGLNLEIFHSNEKDSVMTRFHKHGFSTENKLEILGESDIKLIQEMYSKPKTVELRAVFNSIKAKVMIRKIVENSMP